MAELPKSLEEAIAQARVATQAAIADGYTRLQVELIYPELKPMFVAEQFLPGFDSYGAELKVFFPDAGAAALARRDWGDVPFKIVDITTGKVSTSQIEPEDQALLFIAPSAVEVAQVEKLCEVAGDRPVILLNPCLQDVAIVGIGYAGRQLRNRFLNNIESCYYLRSLEGAALYRCYPTQWQVWLETSDGYKLISESPTKPVGEELDQIIETAQSKGSPPNKKPKLFANMQRFLRTLSQ